MFRMTNPIREYAWGSATAFSELFGWAPSADPQAEIWMGAHPSAPSTVQTAESGEPAHLDALLEDAQPLPYLLKVLAAERPLSIQAHPDSEHARAGHRAENDAGVPADVPERNYPDPRHKPEMIVAVSSFDALCGFRPHAEAAADLRALDQALDTWAAPTTTTAHEVIAAILERMDAEDHAGAVDHILRSGEHQASVAAQLVNELVTELALEATFAAAHDDVRPEAQRAELADYGLSAELLETLQQITHFFPGDPGVFVALLLNRLRLAPGEALYLPAGNMHAYLAGVGIEIMANSDNVLRGGLTTKHVDVEELLAVTDCQVLPVPRCEPEIASEGRSIYRPPFEEFQLQRIVSQDDAATVPVGVQGPTIVLCLRGGATLHPPAAESGEVLAEDDLRLAPGESAFLPEGTGHRLSPAPGSEVFVASPGASGDQGAGS